MVTRRLSPPSIGTAVYVPISDLEFRTGTATVTDALTRQQIAIPRAQTFLLGTFVCVRARLVEDAGPLLRVEFFDGRRCWTRPFDRVLSEDGE